MYVESRNLCCCAGCTACLSQHDRFSLTFPDRTFWNKIREQWVYKASPYYSPFSIGIVLGYGLDDQGSRVQFLVGLGIILFITVSRTALVPTWPPIQWVPGALSLRVKWLGCEADQSPPSSVEVKECMELYVHFPICLRDLALG
jgi:hypothetical protein